MKKFLCCGGSLGLGIFYFYFFTVLVVQEWPIAMRAWACFIYVRNVFLLTGNQSGFLVVIDTKFSCFLFCVGHFEAADILRCHSAVTCTLENLSHFVLLQAATFLHFQESTSLLTETKIEVKRNKTKMLWDMISLKFFSVHKSNSS